MTTNTQKYYNSTFEFSGFLNRARTVNPKKGKPYLAVSLCALSGSVEDPNKTYIDAIVTGGEAIKIVNEIMDTINSKDVSVFGRFRVSDLTLSTYQNAQKESVPVAKGRLLLITYLKASDDSYLHQRGSEDDNRSTSDNMDASSEVPELSSTEDNSGSQETDSVEQNSSNESQGETSATVVNSSEIEVTHTTIEEMTPEQKDAMLKALLAQQPQQMAQAS